jgi:hypothetical protein
MNKLMRAKEQERRARDAKIDEWWKRHFHNVTEGTALYASLVIARDDLKRALADDETPLTKETQA